MVRGTFRYKMEKDQRKSNFKLIFKKRKEMRKNDKKGRNPNMSEDCCATDCDVREGSCFQSSEKWQWSVADNLKKNS